MTFKNVLKSLCASYPTVSEARFQIKFHRIKFFDKIIFCCFFCLVFFIHYYLYAQPAIIFIWGEWAKTATNCKIWVPYPNPLKPGTAPNWSGACKSGLATGSGTLNVDLEFGPLRYTGMVEGGKPSGIGRLERPDGIIYEGEMYAGAYEGHGKVTFPDGWSIETDFRSTGFDTIFLLPFPAGTGFSRIPDLVHLEGIFSHNVHQGRARITVASGDSYEGDMVDFIRNGFGTLTSHTGDKFTGMWRDGLPNGEGTLMMADGQVFPGTWRDGCLVDKTKRVSMIVHPSTCPE